MVPPSSTSPPFLRPAALVLLALVLTLVGCDSAGTSDSPPDEDPPPSPSEEDTTAPAAPTSLEGQSEETKIALTWAAVDAPDLAGYNVYRSTAPIDDVDDRTSQNESLLTETRFADTTAEAGTTFHYAVTAVDTASNESAPSAPVQKTLVGPPVGGFTNQPAPIVVDGNQADWTTLDVRQADVGDEDGPTGIERLWMAHTEQHLFLRLTVDAPISLEVNNNLTLYLDTDNDPTTGPSTLGLGAELEWTFGQRTGRLGSGRAIDHEDIGIASLPTVRADTFEIALDRSAQPGGAPLFSGDSLRIALSANGDRLPDDDGGLGYVLSDTDAAADAPSIDRPDASDVRLLSYNVPNNFDRNRSSLFESDVQRSVRSLLQAVGPDVIGFQEMFDDSATRIEGVAENELGVSEAWNWEKTGGELVLGTRYSIINTHTIPGADNQPSGAFLLNTQEALGDSLVVVLMHPKCCSGASEDRSRQETVDGVAAFLRDVTRGDGPFGVGAETPIAIAGDMNFVGDPQQPRTLRTGQIQNSSEFGAPARPDWDGSPLLDTNPRQTAAPLHATTFSAGSSFPPGRLDYAYVTDSVLEVVHAFALTTRTLSDAELDAYGLQRNDTATASDHLPLVVDLALR